MYIYSYIGTKTNLIDSTWRTYMETTPISMKRIAFPEYGLLWQLGIVICTCL
jgi:hypothetical protein